MTITLEQTVGEIAAGKPATTRVFEKLGIDYCCGGGRTLAEVCAGAKLNADETLAALSRSAFVPAASGKNWQKEPLADLISHIQNTHHVFVRSECPRIEALAAKVVGVHGKNHAELAVVQETFSGLAEELSVHLMKEEQILFPYVVRMEESRMAGEPAPPSMCFGTVQNPIRMMIAEHDGAGEALRTLRSLTNNYTAPGDACISYKTLYIALQEFEADLHQHIHLENNVLFPRAAAMEEAK